MARKLTVSWSIDVEIDEGHTAAAQAVADRYFQPHIAAGAYDSACMFVVTDHADGVPVNIDLAEDSGR